MHLSANDENSATCFKPGTVGLENFLCVQDNNLASKILSREFKKYCTPISKISFKVPNSFKLSVFDVFKFSSKKLGINNMILRIIEVSADEYEKNYYEITATEDIYNANDYEVITYQDSNVEKIDYSKFGKLR